MSMTINQTRKNIAILYHSLCIFYFLKCDVAINNVYILFFIFWQNMPMYM